MKRQYTSEELELTQSIVAHLQSDDLTKSIETLQKLKDDVYVAIPDKQRRSRGITWVIKRICGMLVEISATEKEIKDIALTLHENIEKTDKLQGVPIFLMGEYGMTNPTEVLDFFEAVADADQWEVREFAAGGFQQLLEPNKAVVLPWLNKMTNSESPNVRRFVSEMLRPVSTGRWLRQEPDYSLSVLRLLYRETHPYPRTSVGNNLSDLSKDHPEKILAVVEELVKSKDENSYWIAQRACRNLVKKYPDQVLDALGVDEYHYKDRHYSRCV